jgi:hypothetical protein
MGEVAAAGYTYSQARKIPLPQSFRTAAAELNPLKTPKLGP